MDLKPDVIITINDTLIEWLVSKDLIHEKHLQIDPASTRIPDEAINNKIVAIEKDMRVDIEFYSKCAAIVIIDMNLPYHLMGTNEWEYYEDFTVEKLDDMNIVIKWFVMRNLGDFNEALGGIVEDAPYYSVHAIYKHLRIPGYRTEDRING